MSKRIKYLFLVTILAALSSRTETRAQNIKNDSMFTALITMKEDTNKVNILNTLGWELMYGNPDTSIVLSMQALSISERLKWEKGTAISLNRLAVYNWLKGNYPKAQNYNFKALKIAEEFKYQQLTARILGNIGLVFWSQGEDKKALDYYSRALKMSEKLGDKNGIAKHFGNIGNVYNYQKDYIKALEYYLKALRITKELDDKNGIATWLSNIGSIYMALSDYSKGLEYSMTALQMGKELGNKNFVAINMGNIGSIYTKTGKFKEAEMYLQEALSLSEKIGYKEGMKEFNNSLSVFYDTVGKYKESHEHYKLYIVYRDSLLNEENTKKQTEIDLASDFGKQQTADSITNAEQIKQEEFKHNQEIQQQKIYTYLGAIGFLLMIIVAGVSFRAFTQKQKANETISAQKLLVEEKQKQVLDSIHYAKRIQQSLLPTEKYIERNIKRLKNKD